MISIKQTATLLCAFMLSAGPAGAATVMNQNKVEHTLTVDRGEQETDHKIASGASLQLDCKEPCVLRLRDGATGYDSIAESGEKLFSNEKGFLIYSDREMETGSVDKSKK